MELGAEDRGALVTSTQWIGRATPPLCDSWGSLFRLLLLWDRRSFASVLVA